MTVRKNVIANYIGQGLTALMAFAFIPVYVKFLGIEAIGLIGLFALLQGWLSLLDFGLTPTLSREMARFDAGAHTASSIRGLLRSLEIATYSIAIGTVAIMWISSEWLASNWLKADQLPTVTIANAIPIIGLLIGVKFCENIYRGAILGLQRQVWANFANVAIQTLRNAGAVAVIAFISPTIEAFFGWQAIVSLLGLYIYCKKLDRLLPLSPTKIKFSLEGLTQIRNFASGMFGINLLVVLLTQVDKLILSKILPLEQFGYYTLAGGISSVILMAVAPIAQAFYPRLVHFHSEIYKQELSRLFHQGSQLVTVAIAPAMLALVIFPVPAVYVWSGDWNLATKISPIMVPLVIGSFLNGLMWMPYQTQLAHGWTSLSIKINIVAVVVLIPCILVVVPAYGAIGAAWIWVSLNAAYVVLAAHLMFRRILKTEKSRWYIADILAPTASAFVVIVFAYLLIVKSGQLTRIQWLGCLSTLVIFASIFAAIASDELSGRMRAWLFSRINSKKKYE